MAGVIKVWSVDCHQLVWSYDVDDLEASIYCYYLAYAVERCLSVHPSVTRRYSVKTAKHIIKVFHCRVAIPF